MQIKEICCFFIFSFTFITSSAQKKLVAIKAPTVTYRNLTPVKIRDCWHHLDIEKDTMPGTSLNRAYKDIIKNKKGTPIIVAVIDTDIDINHEDLKPSIWVNKKEIPNNGKDDDHNGYIDDINGWNFLGNKKGENVSFGNNSSVRVLWYLKKKHTRYPNLDGNKIDSLLYIKAKSAYVKDSNEIILLKQYAIENLARYRTSMKALKNHFGKTDFTFAELDDFYNKNKNGDKKLLSDIDNIWYYTLLGKNEKELKQDSIRVDYKAKYSYNENYSDRTVIGDNEYDLKDKHYGNNDVSKNAKMTYHGTIVSGIIGANRANKIGVEGFSDQIKIMPIVAAPVGGTENEKDVTLAIHYAVDNGAKVISMSFGSPLYFNPKWIKEAFLYAQKHDVLLVAGSGNDATDNDKTPFYPIDYDEQTDIEYCANFIKVSAITKDGDKYFLPSWTNYGKKNRRHFCSRFFCKNY